MRTYDKKIFETAGLADDWVQESESFSRHRGTIRGLHFQHPPSAESKLIRVTSGEAFIVWVDIRKGSETFGAWDSLVLSERTRSVVYIPRGFANGMCTLSDNCALFYKIDNYFSSEAQDEILWNDPDIGIEWSITEPKIISERDRNAKSFKVFIERYGGLSA